MKNIAISQISNQRRGIVLLMVVVMLMVVSLMLARITSLSLREAVAAQDAVR